MIPYKELVDKILSHFKDFQIENIPRNNNMLADAMASVASLTLIEVEGKETTFTIKNLETSTIAKENSKMVSMAQTIGYEVRPWYQHIYKYLKDGIIDTKLDRKEQVRMKRLATRYVIIGDVLYKISFNGILSRCLLNGDVNTTLEHAHGGACRGHFNERSVFGKLIRMGYWWPTMEHDCHEHVKKCEQCQRHAHLELTPTQELNYVTSPWPFSMWDLIFMGVINPPSSEGHKFILVATEYYTKWVEVIYLKIAIQKQIVNFIKEYIICRFGIPQRLIMDNETNFTGKDVIEFCKKMKIDQRFSSIYYPQGNGQAEATNKTIKKILVKIIQQNERDWHDR